MARVSGAAARAWLKRINPVAIETAMLGAGQSRPVRKAQEIKNSAEITAENARTMPLPDALKALLHAPKIRHERLKPEEAIMFDIVTLLRFLTHSGKLRAVWWHTPNQLIGSTVAKDYRNRKIPSAIVRAVITKACGLVPGAPDLVILGHKSLLVEVKSKPRGGVSSSQEIFRRWSEDCGLTYLVCRSAKEFEEILVEHGFIQPLR